MVNVNFQVYYFNIHFCTLGPNSLSCTIFLIKHHPSMDKITIKGPIQVSGHSLKLHFYMFERSQMKHNNLDCHNVFGVFSINLKVYILKAWHKSKVFLHLQNIQTLWVDSLCCFKNVHRSFWKLERILTSMIRRVKRLELMKKRFMTYLNTFGSKMFLTLKLMNLKNVPLIKVVHVYVIEGMNA